MVLVKNFKKYTHMDIIDLQTFEQEQRVPCEQKLILLHSRTVKESFFWQLPHHSVKLRQILSWKPSPHMTLEIHKQGALVE